MLRKPKILVIGSFMMDLIASAPRVPGMGETVIGTSFRTAPGGKGANQAVQAARLGAAVTMAGCVGNDSFGKEMLETAKASGVDVSHVKISSRSASGVGNIQLEVKSDGVQNRIMVVPGANYDLTADDLQWMKEEVKNYDIVMLQLEMTMPVTLYAAETAHQAGVPVMLNPAPAAPLSTELLSCVTYLSPNEYEAALIAGVPFHADRSGFNMKNLKAVTDTLRAKGVEQVIVTLGSNGSALADTDGIMTSPCIKMPEVKDPTAAGDSFVAAFCTGVTAGLTKKQAMTFASYTAAITVSGMGAMPSLPSVEQVRDLMMERNETIFDPAELNTLIV